MIEIELEPTHTSFQIAGESLREFDTEKCTCKTVHEQSSS